MSDADRRELLEPILRVSFEKRRVVLASGKLARLLSLVDRGEGASAALARRGLALEALYTRADLPI